MTMPVEPATGDPAPATGDASQQQIDPTEPTQQQPATGDDWGSLFEGMSPAEVRRALDNSRKWETRAKSNKAKLDELQATSLPAEGEEDWKAKYEAEQARASEAESRAVELTYETTVTRIAAQVGADAEALLDSQKFRDAVAKELDEDGFDDDELKAAVLAKAKEFVKKPRFAAARTGGGASGGDFTGSPGAAASIDQQIADAEKRRDFPTAIALKRHRAALRQ